MGLRAGRYKGRGQRRLQKMQVWQQVRQEARSLLHGQLWRPQEEEEEGKDHPPDEEGGDGCEEDDTGIGTPSSERNQSRRDRTPWTSGPAFQNFGGRKHLVIVTMQLFVNLIQSYR